MEFFELQLTRYAKKETDLDCGWVRFMKETIVNNLIMATESEKNARVPLLNKKDIVRIFFVKQMRFKFLFGC